MNNNRGNNRRRGRGNNRQQGQQVNRVDSRARGNAPQMLEKYRKLAHDAHLNGERVQEEYYLQFADHYFRVLADQKQRQDDARQRRDDRGPENGDSSRSDEPRYRDDDDYLEDGDDTPSSSGGDRDRSSDGERPSNRERTFNRERPSDRERPAERSRPVERAVSDDRERPAEPDEDTAHSSEEAVYEPAQNPFVRDNAAVRGAVKPRKPRRPREPAPEVGEGETSELNLGVDPSVLPPSIGADKTSDETEAEVKPRRRTRKPKASEDKPSDDSGEKLEAVS